MPLALYAELDVTVALALSPYVDGARPAWELADVAPRPVAVLRSAPICAPLAWPYPDMGYPDLSLYLDATGTRSTAAVPTAGREAIL